MTIRCKNGWLARKPVLWALEYALRWVILRKRRRTKGSAIAELGVELGVGPCPSFAQWVILIGEHCIVRKQPQSRSATNPERSLRNLCIRRRVGLPILKDDAMHSTRDLWTAAKAHAPGLTADATLIADIEAHPTILLDDLAHATVSTITQPQADALLAAVEGGRSTPLSTRLDRLP